MYSTGDYLWMVRDGVRAGEYASAIKQVVRRGDRVLEIGAGFGFFSIVAAQCGAAHVDAIDVNPVIHLGPRVAAANGCADRITFQQIDSTRLDLAAKADVILSDLRGSTPFSKRSLATLIDARRRLARPGTRFIAAADTIFASPCRAPQAFRRRIQSTSGSEPIDLGAVERVVSDTPMACSIDPSDLAATGLLWCSLDYATVEHTDHQGAVQWTFEQDAVIDGIAVWFATNLGGGYGFSTEPGSQSDVYPNTFLPFRHSALVKAAETLELRLAVRLVGGEYVWEWRAVASSPTRHERLLAHQNSLAELVVDPDALRAAQPSPASERAR